MIGPTTLPSNAAGPDNKIPTKDQQTTKEPHDFTTTNFPQPFLFFSFLFFQAGRTPVLVSLLFWSFVADPVVKLRLRRLSWAIGHFGRLLNRP
jgi:hypothetical protein